MASSRVFLDCDVQATQDYLTWLGSNLDIANSVNAEIVTKTETVIIGELFSYIKQERAKLMSLTIQVHYEELRYLLYSILQILQVAWFECTATIVHGSAWYYVACGGCHTKATKGPTSLMCKKCGKAEVAGVPQYLTKLSVYGNNYQAVFVLLGDVGVELTGKQAAELVKIYFEANESIGDDHLVPVPQALIDFIERLASSL